MEFEHSGIFLVEMITKNVVLGSSGTYVMHMRINKVFLISGLPDQCHNISDWTLPIKQSFYPLNQHITNLQEMHYQNISREHFSRYQSFQMTNITSFCFKTLINLFLTIRSWTAALLMEQPTILVHTTSCAAFLLWLPFLPTGVHVVTIYILSDQDYQLQYSLIF